MEGVLIKRRVVARSDAVVALLILAVMIPIAACAQRSSVRSVLTVEAGSAFPAPEAFLLNESKQSVTISSGISATDMTVPGDYPMILKLKSKFFDSILRVVDTVAPRADAVPVTAVQGEMLAAGTFVSGITDATAVTVTYEQEPDFQKPGEQNVTVCLRDMGGNQTTLSASLLVIGVLPSVTVEASDDAVLPEAAMFLTHPDAGRGAVYAESISPEQLNTPGSIPVSIRLGSRVLSSFIVVTDTTPPSAHTMEQTIWQGDEPTPDSFVQDIRDVSHVTAAYPETPDFTTPGTHGVKIILTDDFNNSTELVATVTVEQDTEPPVITGVRDMTVLTGEKVSYRNGITVTDNRDGDVALSVDSSQVNLNAEGTYSVSYTAVDTSGNKTTESATIKVLALTEDAVNEIADEVLAKILKTGMTQREQAKAIHRWVRNNIKYTGSAEKDNVGKGAYLGFKNRTGDCFTFYAVSEFLLTRAGIPSMRVSRVGGRSNHYWNLIQIESGWYHLDACPTPIWVDNSIFTSVQAEKFTKDIGNNKNYYVYDKTLYPSVVGDPEEPADAEAPAESAP